MVGHLCTEGRCRLSTQCQQADTTTTTTPPTTMDRVEDNPPTGAVALKCAARDREDESKRRGRSNQYHDSTNRECSKTKPFRLWLEISLEDLLLENSPKPKTLPFLLLQDSSTSYY